MSVTNGNKVNHDKTAADTWAASAGQQPGPGQRRAAAQKAGAVLGMITLAGLGAIVISGAVALCALLWRTVL